MGLGANNTTAKTEFVEAMRARLAASDDPSSADNVDNPEIQKNFAALGQAVFRICTVHAEPFSNTTIDPVFWTWLTGVNAWLKKLSTWQKGIDSAIQAWQPTQPAEQNFKNALLNIAKPGDLPASVSGTPAGQTPTELKGKIR